MTATTTSGESMHHTLSTRPGPGLSADGRCPCGSGDTYGNCCQPLHGGKPAATAEALMRSRFSAFAVGDEHYLLRTWHPDERPDGIELDHGLRWYRLDINHVTGGGPFEEWGTVDFTAYYRPRPGAEAPRGAQRENSRFRRQDGQWFYVDGNIIPA